MIRHLLPFLLLSTSALADYSGHARAPELLQRLQDDYAFSPAQIADVRRALASAEQLPKLIEAEQTAKEKTLTWTAYRKIHVHASNLANGAQFLAEHHVWLARAEAEYGVEPTVIAAIMGVETKYGRFTGRIRVLDALATQGFDHPTRAAFFFSELLEFFVLCRNQGFDPATLQGSYAGAMGMAQFMPSNYRKLAVDFDGDGKVDLWTVPDAIGSIARYLVGYDSGRAWQRGQPVTVPARVTGNPLAAWSVNASRQSRRLSEYLRLGVSPAMGLPLTTPVGLIELSVDAQEPDQPPVPEYWLGLTNFYSVMSYNPRVYYAMAVSQLADALQNPATP